MDDADGKFLVKNARKVIEEYVRSGKAKVPRDVPERFREKSGVFTTLHTYPDRQLRGCIGFPEPVMPLMEALVESAVSACRDPRFPPLSEEELGKVIVEVSVLTKPERLKVRAPTEYGKLIKLGRDGLIIENGMNRGLLLPQVPVEWEWDVEEYLENLCLKAGLPRGAWKDGESRILSFRSEIFSEKKPDVS